MNNTTNYASLLAPLFKQLRLEAPAEITGQGCVLTVEPGIPVYIIPDWQEHILLVSHRRLPELGDEEERELLWTLMDDSVFSELPPVQLSAVAEERMLIIWTHYPLVKADNVQALTELFTRFIRRADGVLYRVERYEQANQGRTQSYHTDKLNVMKSAELLFNQRLAAQKNV